MGRKRECDEMQIIQMVAEGMSNKEMASKLNRTEATVESWRTRIIKDYDCRNAAHLVSIAYKKGILTM